MGFIDRTQHVFVELSGTALLFVGVINITHAGGLLHLPGTVTLSTTEQLLVLILGLYMMGYRKLPNKLLDVISQYRR